MTGFTLESWSAATAAKCVAVGCGVSASRADRMALTHADRGACVKIVSSAAVGRTWSYALGNVVTGVSGTEIVSCRRLGCVVS